MWSIRRLVLIMANPWFRMYSEFANDPKVQMMNEAMQRRYVMIMCMRCSNDLVTLHETEIAFHLRITEDELEETKSLFIRKGFVDEDWNVLNWDKRQFVSDSSSARVARHRRNKKESGNDGETLQKQDSNVIEQIQNRTDTDKLHGACAPVASQADDHAEPAPKPALQCPTQKIVDAYHELMPDNPRVRVLDEARKRTISARWREAARNKIGPFGYDNQTSGLEAWKKFFSVCNDSDFLTGKTSPGFGRTKPFIADLDFLMSPKGFKGCLENKYHRDE